MTIEQAYKETEEIALGKIKALESELVAIFSKLVVDQDFNPEIRAKNLIGAAIKAMQEYKQES